MQAVEQLGYRVTVGDVTRAGLNVNLAQQGLLTLATDAGGHLQVAESGEIVYLFPKTSGRFYVTSSCGCGCRNGGKKFGGFCFIPNLVWDSLAGFDRANFSPFCSSLLPPTEMVTVEVAVPAAAAASSGGEHLRTSGSVLIGSVYPLPYGVENSSLQPSSRFYSVMAILTRA